MNNTIKDILVAVWIVLFSALAGLSYLNINKTTQNFTAVVTQLNRQVKATESAVDLLRQLDKVTARRFDKVQRLLDLKKDKKVR